MEDGKVFVFVGTDHLAIVGTAYIACLTLFGGLLGWLGGFTGIFPNGTGDSVRVNRALR